MADGFDFEDDVQPAPKHSRLGLTSFFLTLASQVLFWGGGALIAGAVLVQGEEVEEGTFMLAIWIVGVGVVLNVVALILGLVGLFQRECRKLLVIVGLIVSVPTLLLFLAIWVHTYLVEGQG